MKLRSTYVYNLKCTQLSSYFILDINEPTTSKGIRHFGMDVQCGPDAVAPFSMLSATTSLTRMPKMFTTGIKIGDSLTDTNVNKECGTCTTENDDVYKMIVPRRKSVGIVIKDSPTKMRESVVECSTMTIKRTDYSIAAAPDLYSETMTIKSACSAMKTEDSWSEFCSSIFSSKTKITCASQSPPREIEIKGSDKSPLCCGGVQVHSYREKQESEDVMYQGEWQRHRPRIHTKKKQFIPVLIKRTGSSKIFWKKFNSKEKNVDKRDYPVIQHSTASEPMSPTRFVGGFTRIKQNEITSLTKTEPFIKPPTKIKLSQVKFKKPNVDTQIKTLKIRKPINNVTKVTQKST